MTREKTVEGIEPGRYWRIHTLERGWPRSCRRAQYTARQGATSAFAGPFLQPDMIFKCGARRDLAPYKSKAQVSPLYLRAGTLPESRDPRDDSTPEEKKPPQDHSYETMEEGK